MVYKNGLAAAIKCNGNIVREDGENVYLPFGSEYSILLKNKESRKALVDIEVDGNNVLNSKSLILNPNETTEIKGFMKDMNNTNAFKFIKKTNEISKHRGDRIDDGLVRISYKFELPHCKSNHPIVYRRLVNTFGVPTYGSSGDFVNYIADNNSSDNVLYSHSFLNSCSEPGITVKGSEVKQGYIFGEIGALDNVTEVIIFNLKGLKNNMNVAKPTFTKSKTTCTTCGRKNKSFNKYCYNCGTYLR